jgi:hypothetical protein
MGEVRPFGNGGEQARDRRSLDVSLLRYAAQSTVRYLSESWKRPVRHNRKLECLALWHTAHLELFSTEALAANPSAPLAGLGPEPVEDEVRYEIEAALRSVAPNVPFTHYEAGYLATPTWAESDAETATIVAQRNPELTSRWHGWLWEDQQARVLAIAATRLDENLAGLQE